MWPQSRELSKLFVVSTECSTLGAFVLLTVPGTESSKKKITFNHRGSCLTYQSVLFSVPEAFLHLKFSQSPPPPFLIPPVCHFLMIGDS